MDIAKEGSLAYAVCSERIIDLLYAGQCLLMSVFNVKEYNKFGWVFGHPSTFHFSTYKALNWPKKKVKNLGK